ncbi:hypothetical protein PMG11_10046 [Penicillium brasilianum]|uniref:Uncharacterized protein n=1 Tax=Penicillium brasilianum TaxID=104259 RepID=A0A0F7U1L6_PENBI|nr:hypothetical protein PMG11_10046 [Penicillium brasilianum]
MVEEAPTIQYYPQQKMTANTDCLLLFKEPRQIRQDIAEMAAKLAESDTTLQALRHSYPNVRQRTFTTWVRDTLHKDTPRRTEDIRRLTKDVIHAGDIRFDAILITERSKKSSSKRQEFSTLYGLTPEDVNALDHERRGGSL